MALLKKLFTAITCVELAHKIIVDKHRREGDSPGTEFFV
jgi:hypothetical protein